MDVLIQKSMEFDTIDFNDLEEEKEYLLAIESDNSFIIARCVRLYKVGDEFRDEVWHTFFFGDQIRDGVITYSGGFTINPDERIKIYNWPPPIDGTGGQNTVNSSGGGTGNLSRKRTRRKNRKSRKNRH
jgi:hypothetical protein